MMLFAVVLLLMIDLVVLFIVAVSTAFHPYNSLNVTQFIAPLAITGGVLVALLSLMSNNRKKASEDYLEHALNLLEKSYDALMPLNEDGYPKQSRIAWLTSARLLRASEQTAERIPEMHHRHIYDEQKEYWRGRFYDLLKPDDDGLPSKYFAEKPEHMSGYMPDEVEHEPLSEKSLGVLYRFVRWPQGLEDPIKDEPKFSAEEIEKMELFGPKGLGELLAADREWRNLHRQED